MAGEKNFEEMLTSLSPVLLDGEFVFCTFEDARYGEHSDLDPIAAVREVEGLSLVIPKLKADEHNLSYESVFKAITLMLHSSLDAVGLTAAFSGKLAEHDISANVVAGYFHDHLFVRSEQAQKAMAALNELAH
jgi:hypothetical protein